MNTTELRLNFHQLIDEIENEKMLEQFYELLRGIKKKKGIDDFWDNFTDGQKKEIELAWEESEDDKNLISHNEVMKEAKKWVKK